MVELVGLSQSVARVGDWEGKGVLSTDVRLNAFKRFTDTYRMLC